MRSNWYKRNNFDDNKGYTNKILEKFNIKKFHFVTDTYGCSALLVNIGLNSYRLVVNYDDNKIEIYKKKTLRLSQKHKKEYLKLVHSINTDAIYSSIKWIKNDSELRL